MDSGLRRNDDKRKGSWCPWCSSWLKNSSGRQMLPGKDLLVVEERNNVSVCIHDRNHPALYVQIVHVFDMRRHHRPRLLRLRDLQPAAVFLEHVISGDENAAIVVQAAAVYNLKILH